MSYPWFRAYSEMLHDPKLKRMTPAQRWVWVGLLCLASDSEDRGVLELAPGVAYELDDLALAMDVDAETVDTCLGHAAELGMLRRDGTKLIVVNWDKRQYDNPSDTPEQTRERQRKHRSRDVEQSHEPQAEQVTSAVTTLSREVTTQIRLDSDTDTEADTEAEAAAPSAQAPQDEPEVTAVIDRWEGVVGRLSSPEDCRKLREWLDEFGPVKVNYAIGQCHIYGVPKLVYVWRVLADGGAPASPDPPPKSPPSGPVVILNPITGKREVIGGTNSTAGCKPTAAG